MLLLQVEGYPSGQVEPEQTLLEACEAIAIPVEAACGGFAACNTCRVEVIDGWDHLSPLLDEEIPFLDGPTQRLACQALVSGPVRVRLAPGA